MRIVGNFWPGGGLVVERAGDDQCPSVELGGDGPVEDVVGLVFRCLHLRRKCP